MQARHCVASDACGSDGVDRQSLHEIYPEDPQRVTDLLCCVNFDSTEVSQGKWWVDTKETRASVHDRIEEMLCQVEYAEESDIIIVGHSHYFREIFRHYVCEEFRSANPRLR